MNPLCLCWPAGHNRDNLRLPVPRKTGRCQPHREHNSIILGWAGGAAVSQMYLVALCVTVHTKTGVKSQSDLRGRHAMRSEMEDAKIKR